MIDLHSHVLPGIDDGSQNLQMTKAILKGLFDCGVTKLALTPHFYPAKNSVSHFLQSREEAFQALLTLPEAKKFEFLLGAEVYFTETLFNSDDLAALCYGKTDLIMVEPCERDAFTPALRDRLEKLSSSYSLTPVLAHIDRFPYLFRNRKILAELREMGCLFQMNVSSLFHFGTSFSCRRLLKDGWVDFLGSDLHRPIPDPAKFSFQLQKLNRKMEEPMARIEKNSLSLFGGTPNSI